MVYSEFIIYIGGFFFLYVILLLIAPSPIKPGKSTTKTVIIETMQNPEKINKEMLEEIASREIKNMNLLDDESFCEMYKGRSQDLEIQCNKLSKDNCNSKSCCFYTNTNKCVAGNKSGPTYTIKN